MRRTLLIAGGGVAGAAWLRSRAAARRRPGAVRELVVTIACPPERITEGGLPAPLAEVIDRADLTVRPAPGGKGTEVGLRQKEPDGHTGLFSRASGRDPRQELRTALRETKALVETGEVLLADVPSTTKRTISGLPVDIATARAQGEGRL